jgi:hypothetical protein
MKLIIERIDGVVYAYSETERHHRAASKTRSTPAINPSVLAFECDLSHYGNFHMVFDVKRSPKRKNKNRLPRSVVH